MMTGTIGMHMENITQMRKRHEEEIENLQKKCKHKQISDWTDYMWAPGHYGMPVKYCMFCGKILKQKNFKQTFVDEECSTQTRKEKK